MTKHTQSSILNAFFLAFALGFLLVVAPVHADHMVGPIEPGAGSMAIDGYDPVAYYTMGRAVRGSENFSYSWLGANWQFVNAEHQKLFAEDPLTYAPQYGGYCSDANLSHGEVNPMAFRIVNNRLYLFYREETADAWSNNKYAVGNAEATWDRVKAGLAP